MTEKILLVSVPKSEVPPLLRVETYFDLKAHPFWHQGLFEREDVNSVYTAILAIDDYAKGWLAENLSSMKAQNQAVVQTDTVDGAFCSGTFEAVMEKDAVFQPARVIGDFLTRAFTCIICVQNPLPKIY